MTEDDGSEAAGRAAAGAGGGGSARRRRAETQTQRVAALLREKIRLNAFPAGAHILESELAEMFEVSRTPIREAMLLLETAGLVEITPRRGCRVLPISAEDMDEIYTILTELEALAAELAARRRPSDAQSAAIEALLDGMEAALARDDRAEWAALDDAFHRALAALSENRRLITTIATFQDQAHRARMVTLYMRPAPHASNADHRRLFDAIRSGDAAAARRIHREHRRAAKALLLGILSAKGVGAL